MDLVEVLGKAATTATIPFHRWLHVPCGRARHHGHHGPCRPCRVQRIGVSALERVLRKPRSRHRPAKTEAVTIVRLHKIAFSHKKDSEILSVMLLDLDCTRMSSIALKFPVGGFDIIDFNVTRTRLKRVVIRLPNQPDPNVIPLQNGGFSITRNDRESQRYSVEINRRSDILNRECVRIVVRDRVYGLKSRHRNSVPLAAESKSSAGTAGFPDHNVAEVPVTSL